MADQTSQDRGRALDFKMAKRFGGEAVKGSGSQTGFKLDMVTQNRVLVGECKHTDAMSYSVTTQTLDKVKRAVLGPESAKAGVDAILITELGDGQLIASLDLELLLSWIEAPPAIVPATKEDTLRHTARIPPHLR